MDFGFSIPSGGINATPEIIARLARRGEELGFAYIGIPDHIVIPNNVESRYPYSEDGTFSGSGYILDQLTVASFISGQTSKARILTSVLVLPHRSAVLAAKMLASIDVLSNGRLTVGCGVGWLREEFEAIGAPAFDERGFVANEYISCFKELWTKDNPSFDGEYIQMSDIIFEPKPTQKPYPPIWIGGESPAALRRAAELGDGWYPLGSNPRFPLQTAEQFSNALEKIYRHGENIGRDFTKFDLAYSSQSSFTETTDQIVENIRAFKAVGVQHLMVSLGATFSAPVSATIESMERFASEIAPQVNS